MKTFYLIFFLLFSTIAFCSNDTLTRAQVYNFSVGDTFDYEHMTSYSPQYNLPSFIDTFYTRYIIMSIYYSVDSSTLYIARKKVYPSPVSLDTLMIDSLNQYQYLIYYYDIFNFNLIDTSSFYDNRTLNNVLYSLIYASGDEKFANGLGIVYSDLGAGDPDDGFNEDGYQLIYYSNGSQRRGTPYEVVSGIQFINYMPIPEECATWIRTVYYFDAPSDGVMLQEKITEGNKVPFNGQVYIELLYSYYDYFDTTSGEDSLIGYFRNDTLNQSAYLYDSLTDTPFLTYNFTTQPGQNGICGIDTINFSTGYRAKWLPCTESYPFNQNSNEITNEGMIEGTGGGGSILPVQFPSWPPGSSPHFNGQLTSFCVCGNVLYSADTFSACSIPTAIKKISSPIHVQLFPNPSADAWQLMVDESLIGNNLQVYNAQGRLVFQSVISNQKSEISFNASPGVYFLQIASPQVNIVRKLVRL